LIRRHRSRERDPGARGLAFGRAHREAVATTLAVYERMLGLEPAALLSAGAAVGESLAARRPGLVRELEGIAEGAGAPPELVLAINARTELLAAAPVAAECSVIALAEPRGGHVLAQNWDWHPAMRNAMILWRIEQPGGRWFVTLTEAGMLAKLGLSSAGLACGLNFLRCSRDGGLDGIPIHALLRMVLEECASVSDAVALLRSVRVCASAAISLADADDLVTVELSPGGAEVLRAPVHTNHFLAPLPAGVDLERAEAPGTLLRFKLLETALAGGAREPEALLRSHANRPDAVCRHDDGRGPWAQRRATLASLVMRPRERSLRVAWGAPCGAAYEEVA
jgi:isopenicillin-N N-acyltransferase-like protein